MAVDVNLQELDSQYPCDKRLGYAKACDCRKDADPDGLDRKLVRCDYQSRNVKGALCKSCRYQRRYVESINSNTE